MTTLFIGSEDVDFQVSGTVQYDTNSSHYRSSNVRYALAVSASSDGLTARFAPVTRFWFTAQVAKTGAAFGSPLFQLLDGSTVVYTIRGNASGGLGLIDSGSMPLVTDTPPVLGGLTKIDFLVDLAAGKIVGYAAGQQVLSYTGQAVSGTLDGVMLTNPGGDATAFSEVLVSTACTRTAQVFTLVPTALSGDWTGTLDAVTETQLVANTYITGTTANATANLALTMTGGNLPISAVQITTASSGDGQTPDTINVGFASITGSYYGDDIPLANGITAANSSIFETNPITGHSWQIADINYNSISVKVSSTADGYLMYEDGKPLNTNGNNTTSG